MIEKLILVLTIILFSGLFGNIFLKRENISKYFNNAYKIFISMIISVISYMVTIYIVKEVFLVPPSSVALIDGIFIGWILSLFNHIKVAKQI